MQISVSTTLATAVYALLAWGDVGHSGTLSDYAGATNITAADTVLENQRFTSTITQASTATGLVFRNCHFDLEDVSYGFNNNYTQNHAADVTFIDCTFEGTLSAQIILGGSGAKTFRRCRFRDARADMAKIKGTGATLFDRCYFGGLSRTQDYPSEDIHADLFQNDMGSGGTLTLRGCTIDAPPADEGTPVPVTSGSWLESDGVDSGFTAGEIYYRGNIAFFPFNNCAGVNVIEDCFFRRVPKNGLQHATSVGSTTVTRTKWWPDGTYIYQTYGDIGTWIDGGGNEWAVTGTDLRGISRTAGEAILFDQG